MIFLNKKNKILLTSTLALSSMSIQSAHATSEYSSSASFTYTITASNQNVNGDLSSLDIYESYLDYSAVFVSSTSSAWDIVDNYSGLGTSHTLTFNAADNISDGFAASEYFADYILSFENLSSDVNDIFDITVDYSYALTTYADGQNADTTSSIAYSNEDYALDGFDYSETSIAGGYADSPITLADSFNFTLFAGDFENLYVQATIGGTLEAVAPVPVPAAFWLFGTAIMALPGIRKYKAA